MSKNLFWCDLNKAGSIDNMGKRLIDVSYTQ
jgi:hypothetical protein